MSPKLKAWLLLGGIFLVGILTGSGLTFSFAPHFFHPSGPPGPQDMRDRWMNHLVDKLSLTADQQTKIGPILTDASNQIQKLHHDEVQRGSEIIKSANDQIAGILTADQKTKLQQMESDREKMFMGHVHPWGGGPPREGPDGRPHWGEDGGNPPPPPGGPPPAGPDAPPPPSPDSPAPSAAPTATPAT